VSDGVEAGRKMQVGVSREELPLIEKGLLSPSFYTGEFRRDFKLDGDKAACSLYV
jgi:hypothetical protein